MNNNSTQTPETIQAQILDAKINDKHNYEKIQKLQQLLDKLTKKN